MNMKTTYLGLELKNPVLAASCSLSKDIEGIRNIEKAGAGAVVLKSMFEEQMDRETREIEEYIEPGWHTEAYDYVRNMGMQLGPKAYLDLIREAKASVSIPVIASLNCVSTRWWGEYATKLEKADADAVELNIAYMPHRTGGTAEEIESLYFRIVEEVRERVSLPVAVKIGPYFTSLEMFAGELVRRGVAGLVLFNRFYQVDIDIEKVRLKPGYRFSSTEEMSLPLRWIALLADTLACDLSGTTGIHDAAGAIKMLLAGASTVQVCSALYQEGLPVLQNMLDDMEAWMEKHGFETVEDFRGRLSFDRGEDSELWERLQYIKALVGVE